MKYPEILAIASEPAEFVYDVDDTILYALGLGAGARPEELQFVYEKNLRALPTFAVIMGGGSGDLITKGGIDLTRIVHGEQRLTIHKPLPPAGRMLTGWRLLGVVDKGKETGALVLVETAVRDAASGVLHATAVMTMFCRGDGGFGGPTDGGLPLHTVPERAPNLEVTIQTLPQQAALYRLNGDRNPLHIDPEMATSVGFQGPILHGLCSYGIACRAIMQECCGNDPARIARFDARFSSPVYPGEAITTRIWRDGNQISFECLIAERGVTVMRNGLCELRD
jgi:acyl dehydratase